MPVAQGLDWTEIVVRLIDVLPAIVAAWLAYLIHRQVKPPSGQTLGKVSEQARDLSAADVALTTQVLKRTANGPGNGDGNGVESRP